jgi:hypothetical protein
MMVTIAVSFYGISPKLGLYRELPSRKVLAVSSWTPEIWRFRASWSHSRLILELLVLKRPAVRRAQGFILSSAPIEIINQDPS